jgi:hypothetical protein
MALCGRTIEVCTHIPVVELYCTQARVIEPVIFHFTSELSIAQKLVVPFPLLHFMMQHLAPST